MKRRLNKRKRRSFKLVATLTALAVIVCLSAAASLHVGPRGHAASIPAEEDLLTLDDGSYRVSTFWPEEFAAKKEVEPIVVEVARQIQGIDGLDVDPITGSIYFSEEDAAKISRIDKDGRPMTIIDATTPVFEYRMDRRTLTRPLQSPEGIALDGSGRLYVVEDIPDGRLIRYTLPEYHHGAGEGEVIPIPHPAAGYAWEAVDVKPDGSILLAGSNLEAFLSGRDVGGLFSGAVLYREPGGKWWMPVHSIFDSYSAACFDAEGYNAYFASETMGTVGCISMTSHFVKAWYSEETIPAPEGIVCLADGTAIVASESGKLYRMDPHDCIVRLGFGLFTRRWPHTRRRNRGPGRV